MNITVNFPTKEQIDSIISEIEEQSHAYFVASRILRELHSEDPKKVEYANGRDDGFKRGAEVVVEALEQLTD